MNLTGENIFSRTNKKSSPKSTFLINTPRIGTTSLDYGPRRAPHPQSRIHFRFSVDDNWHLTNHHRLLPSSVQSRQRLAFPVPARNGLSTCRLVLICGPTRFIMSIWSGQRWPLVIHSCYQCRYPSVTFVLIYLNIWIFLSISYHNNHFILQKIKTKSIKDSNI